LHTNADLTYRQIEAAQMLSTIQETQPKDSGGGDGKSPDEIVKEKCAELLTKMPVDFIEEIFRAEVAKLIGPPGTPDKGFNAPLNIFLFQELQRLQRIIGIVRGNLKNLIAAIDGTVVMTEALLADLNSIFDARVPRMWTHDASGAEISWLMPNVGGWFTGLLDRQVMLSTWLEKDRKHMKAYWLTGFTNPQGFLTGMRQEVTRQKKKEQWALDDVITHTQVLPSTSPDQVNMPPEGQNIYGLFLEGARWNKANHGQLDESEPKKLFVAMPIIYMTAITYTQKKAKMAEYGGTPYNCAVYKYTKRNDRYLIFRMYLRCGEQTPQHWKLRGVCLLATTD
jgi:dynein heavy chain